MLWGWRRALVAFLAGALCRAGAGALRLLRGLLRLLSGSGLAARRRHRSNVRLDFCGACVRPSRSAGGSASAISSPACGGWAAPCWSRPTASPGRCRSRRLGLPAILAVFYGLAAALARLVWTDDIGRIAALAAAFALLEWLRTFLFTGFPWNPIGYAAMPIAAADAIGLGGRHGRHERARGLRVLRCRRCWPATATCASGWRIALLLVAAHVGFGYFRLGLRRRATGAAACRCASSSRRSIRPPSWTRSSRDEIFRTLLDLSAAPLAADRPKPKLILWPETSVPFLFTDRPDALVAIGELLADGQMLLAGDVRAEGQGQDADALLQFRRRDQRQRRDRRRRRQGASGAVRRISAVLGTVPAVRHRPDRRHADAVLGRHGASSHHSCRRPAGGDPSSATRSFSPTEVAAGVKDADFIVNVTNDAWFGDTPGPYQHFRRPRSAQSRPACR